MRSWIRWLAIAIVLVFVAGAVAASLDGPLFPWSPLKPGYTRFRMHRADVYYPAGATLEEPYQKLDDYIEEAETFHQLKMPERITVIAPRNWSDFHRQTPWQSGNGVAGLTMETGTVIWVSPKIAEKHLDTAEYLRHELSHAILDQNMTLLRAHKLHHQTWLSEGLAVDFGRQKSYLTEDDFLARARSVPLAPVFHGDTSDMPFNYIAWRDFLEHMIQTRGRNKFQNYLLRVMQDPDEARDMFVDSFGISFDNAVAEFQNVLRQPRAGD